MHVKYYNHLLVWHVHVGGCGVRVVGQMEYGSTPYIGMAPKKKGCSIVCVQSDMFKTLP